jgi:hypothetical protein
MEFSVCTRGNAQVDCHFRNTDRGEAGPSGGCWEATIFIMLQFQIGNFRPTSVGFERNGNAGLPSQEGGGVECAKIASAR